MSGGQRRPGSTGAPSSNFQAPVSGSLMSLANPALAIDAGTQARWRMPAPRCSSPASPQPPAVLACVAPPATRQPGPDLSYLFMSCGAPQKGLSEKDYADAAELLGVEVAAIKAVADVETRGDAFNGEGRPTILFERHYFHRLTAGKHRKAHPDLSNPKAGGYGKFSQQYPKLERAFALNRDAALQSASWGRFQIMGANFSAAGFQSVAQMVERMAASEGAHLQAFVSFVQANNAMHKALKEKNWAGFARRYNGPKYKTNHYDTEMAKAYELHKPPPAPATQRGRGLGPVPEP